MASRPKTEVGVGPEERFAAGRNLIARATAPDGEEKHFPVRVRIDTPGEILYFEHGGILQYVLRQLAGAA